jgi:DNA-binding transcriptional LysR family regulator
MQLTDAGRDVVAYAQRVESLLVEMESTLAARKGLSRGRLRLSATTTAGEYLLPPLVAAFRQQHPGVQVTLHVGNREGVLRALSTGEADLAVMGRPPATTNLVGRPILPNELVAIAAPHHPRARGPSFAAAELVGEPFFVREQGSGTRLAVERFLEETGLPRDTLVELGSDSAIKQVVMAGLGISILSRQAIELEVGINRLAVLPVIGLPLRRQWFLVQPAADRPPPAVAAFTQFLDQAVGVSSSS